MSNSVRPHRQQPTRLLHPWDSPGKNTGVGGCFLLQRMKAKSETEVTQSCPTVRDPMDCSPPGSSVHGTFQARVLEWGAIAFSAFLPTRVLFAFSRVLPELKGHSYINLVLLHNLRRWEGRYFLSLLSSLPPLPTPFILQMEN